VDELTRKKLLESYAGYNKKKVSGIDFFPVILISFLTFFLLAGLYLRSNEGSTELTINKTSKTTTRFMFEEKKKVVTQITPKDPPVSKSEPEPQKVKEPKDLTTRPLPSQSNDDIVEKTESRTEKKPVRRVYGLKRIYSKGIGASGDASDAIIGKKGNTLDTEIDTFTVTDEELAGELVSITTVTSYPKLKFQVKPEYTEEMLENKIEGVIKAKILIDTDGKVKKVVVLDDLGYGSRQKVHEACLKLEFEPARTAEEPVAVWYMIRFRFEMLNN